MPALDEMIKIARETGATDLHITAGVPPKMRVNGRMMEMNYPRILASDTVEILLEIMTEIQRERFEERGEYDMACSFPGLARCRIHAYKQQGGTALAIRLLEEQIDFADRLGIPSKVNSLYEKESGLALFTGSAGSGKTTTAASLLMEINCRREAHILTLEHPVEYLYPRGNGMVNQREIGIDSADYVSALQAAMHEDVDVILIGELADAETLQMAVTAAENGKLVLAVLPTAVSLDIADYLMEWFPPHRQPQMRRRFLQALQMVVYQEKQCDPEGNHSRFTYEIITPEKLSGLS